MYSLGAYDIGIRGGVVGHHAYCMEIAGVTDLQGLLGGD